MVLDGKWEEAVTMVLQKLLEQELCRGCQEGVFAVGRADVLGWHGGCRAVRHLNGEAGHWRLPITCSRQRFPLKLHGTLRGSPGSGAMQS